MAKMAGGFTAIVNEALKRRPRTHRTEVATQLVWSVTENVWIERCRSTLDSMPDVWRVWQNVRVLDRGFAWTSDRIWATRSSKAAAARAAVTLLNDRKRRELT